MTGYQHDWLKSFEEVQEAGRKFGAEHPGYFEAEIEQGPARRRGHHLLHLRHHRQSQGRDAHPRQRGRRRARRFMAGEDVLVPEDDVARATCRWPGSGDSLYTLVAEPGGRLLLPTARRARRRCSATCASSGPPRVLAPPRIWENMLTAVQVRAADATPLKRWTFELLPRGGRARPRSCARRASRCPLGLRLADARSASSSSTARCATSSACGGPRGRCTGGAPARPRHLPLLPLDRREPQAGLRLHRDDRRSSRCSPTREANPTTAGRPVPGHRGQDRRPRRGAGAGARGLQGLLQERGGDPRGHRPRRLVPHRRRRLHRPPRAPGHHRPRQGRRRPRRTAPRSRRSSSRTSSSSARTSGRRSPSATSKPFVAAMIAIDLEHGGELGGAAGHRLHVATWTSPRSRRSAS